MAKYSPDAFYKIKAVCVVIQERLELEGTNKLQITGKQVWVSKGLNGEDFCKVFELLAQKEKLIRIEFREKLPTMDGGEDVVAYKIEVLPKFNNFIRSELGIFEVGSSQAKDIKKIDYIETTASISINGGERYIDISENRDPIKSKSAKVFEHLWRFATIKRKQKILFIGDKVSEKNLITTSSCKNEEALQKIVQRLKQLLKKKAMPISIEYDNGDYRLIVNLP